MQISNKYAKTLLLATSLSALFACGSADENQDIPSNEETQIEAPNAVPVVVLNGYVANAIVWIDFRDNDAIDGSEPFAFSDKQGYVSYNPNTGTNYCQSEKANEQQYCLKTGIKTGSYKLKAAKGIELLSGESFKSVLSASINAEQASAKMTALQSLGQRPSGDDSDWLADLDANMPKLSPLSSLAFYLPSGVNLVDVLNRNSFQMPVNAIDEEVLNHDYLARLNDNQLLSAQLFEAEVAIGRLVDLISVNMDKATENLDMGRDGLPISNADSAYAALAQAMQSGVLAKNRSTSSTAMTDSIFNELLAIVQQQASSDIATRVQRVITDPALSAQVAQLQDLVDTYFTQANSPSDLLTAQQIATLPTLSVPVAFSNTQTVAAISALLDVLLDTDNALVGLLNAENAGLLDDRTDNSVASVSHDLAELAQVIVEQIKTSGTNEASAVVAQTSLQTLAEIDDEDFSFANKNLSLSGINDGNEYGQVIAFFTGEDNDTSGELVMCVAYRNPQDSSDDISGERFVGNWSEVGSETRLSLVAEGITVQMKLIGEIDGADIPEDSQLAEFEKIAGENYGEFGFRLNEDSANWYSDNASIAQSFGLLSTDNLPSNDADCRALLSI